MRGPYELDVVIELDIVAPLVDGRPLHEIMGGRFPGLATALVAPPAGQYLGQPRYREDHRAVLLDGDCLEAGCCGVMAAVSVEQTVVLWTDFFARGAPRIPAGVSFEFDRQQYEAALASIQDLEIQPLRVADA